MRIYATYNIKGGVGKTSAAVNLAYLASREGWKTLLWDLDPQAAATYLFRIRPRVLLPADFTYRRMDLLLDAARKPTRQLARLLEPLARDYDVVFLDCPPSVSLVSENVLHAADTLIVPIIPTTLCTRTLDQLTGFVGSLEAHQPSILAFFSMVDRRKRLHRDIVEHLPAERTDIATAAIPAMSLIEQMAVRRAPLPVFSPRSEATRCYQKLWEEISGRHRSGGNRQG